MGNLKTTTELVRGILEEKPETRNSDNLLYIKVLDYYSDLIGVDVGGFPFSSALKNLSGWGIPPLETVSRCRRRIQHCHPELCGKDEVEGYRRMKEEAFRDYAKGIGE